MSPLSTSSTLRPRPEASQAMPAPLIPAPTTARSYRVGMSPTGALSAMPQFANGLELRHRGRQLGFGAGDAFRRGLVLHRVFGCFLGFESLDLVQILGPNGSIREHGNPVRLH